MSEWTKDKEKRVLYKYRFMLSIRVLRVLAAVLLIWGLYKIAINIIYFEINSSQKHTFYSNVALELTSPNLQAEFPLHETGEITTFLTQKISYPIYKTVGKEQIYTGEINLKKRPLATFSSRSLKLLEPQSKDLFHFNLPIDPRNDNKLRATEDSPVWKTLQKVPTGTVADLAFSIDKYLTPEQLLTLLADYDLDVLWMPLYTGEFVNFEPNWWGSGNDIIAVAPFGFAGGQEISDDYRLMSSYRLSLSTIKEAEQLTIATIEHLLKNERQGYYETFLGLDNLQERYDYLTEVGFETYGAVVTGPVKELLKLQEIDGLRGAQLGKLEYWNWDKYNFN